MTSKHKQLLVPFECPENGPLSRPRDLFYAHRHSTKIVELPCKNDPMGWTEVLHKDRLLATLAWVVNEMPDMPMVLSNVEGIPSRRDDTLDQVVCSIARVSSQDQPRRDLGRLLAETRLLAFLTPPALRNKGQARLMTKTRSGYIEDKPPRQAVRDFHIIQMNKIKFIEQFLHQNPFKAQK